MVAELVKRMGGIVNLDPADGPLSALACAGTEKEDASEVNLDQRSSLESMENIVRAHKKQVAELKAALAAATCEERSRHECKMATASRHDDQSVPMQLWGWVLAATVATAAAICAWSLSTSNQ